MEYKYKAGDKVRVVGGEFAGDRSKWIGKEVTLKSHDSGGGNSWDCPAWSVADPGCPYRFRESELAPIGPVVTETVTKTRIVPGVYDRVSVWERDDGLFGIDFHVSSANPDELDAAAAVLSALAKGLRDA